MKINKKFNPNNFVIDKVFDLLNKKERKKNKIKQIEKFNQTVDNSEVVYHEIDEPLIVEVVL